MGIGNNCYMTFVLISTCFSLMMTLSLSSKTDTIYVNQSLSGDQTLVSSGGSFEMGFFNPSKSSSSKYYLGIWYKKVSTIPPTVAWVANRDTPISDKSSAVLKIINCNLVLLNNDSNTPIWSTNVTCTPSNIKALAVLLDDGNLILRNGSNLALLPIIWQSFDFPTHTWLPGGKLAYNRKKKTAQLISSWKNSEDPGTGLFSVEPEPNGTQYFIKWNRSVEYWSSGPWNGKIFSLVPEMRSNFIYNFSFFINENESYFTYSLFDKSIISRLIIDVSGQVKQMTWLEQSKEWNLFWAVPRQQCEIYSYCGSFGTCNQNSLPFCNCLTGFKPKSEKDWKLDDHSGGCVRKTNLVCGNSTNGEKDKFLMTSLTQFPEQYSQSVAVGSVSECQVICLSKCSCIAYAYDTNMCFIWKGKLLNLRQVSLDKTDGNGKTIYIRLAASEFPGTKQKPRTAIVGSVAAVVILLGIVFVVVIWRRPRRLFGSGTIKNLGGSLVAFGFRDLRKATKNFSDKLGGGGFGSVFKGTLPDSTVIAVKKLESINQGEKQFCTEVSTIGTIQHVNLVRLRGFCSEGDKKLLVYDYMSNGSLDSHLFYEKVLDWKTRYQIALGIARGLVYLHEKCRDCIIHCDIKPENILLDSEFCPKVADFGLAKLVGRDFSRVLTTMRGTRGYLAPEWISGVAITTKADVYSYGMMLLEIVSGRRNSEPFYREGSYVKFFPCWAANVTIEGGDILSVLDDKLARIVNEEEVTKICRVACWCIQDDENVRPTMSKIVQILEGVLDVEKPSIPRSLHVFLDNLEEDSLVFFTEHNSSSN